MNASDDDETAREAREDMRILQHELRTLLALWVQHADEHGEPRYGRAVALAALMDLCGQAMQEAVEADPAIRWRCQTMIERLTKYIALPSSQMPGGQVN